MQNVQFYFGTQEKFDALAKHNELALYFITDTQRLYKGSKLFATGSDATSMASGLMSKEDKIALDELVANQGKSNLIPVDGTISIVDNKISVAISSQEGNALQKVKDGLFVPTAQEISVPEYSIEKQTMADEGFNSTYKLKRTVNGESSYVGDSINVAIDAVLSSAEFKTVIETDVPYNGAVIGDPYIELGFNDPAKTHLYIPMKGLVDTYVAGDGIKIEDHIVSINLGSTTNGLHFVDGTLNLALATKDSAGAMSAVDKGNLDKLIALDIPITYGIAYEVSSKPTGTLVNYNGKEIRIMCPADTEWALQNVGEGGDSSKYYIGFKAYAPSSEVVSFKESLDKIMTDQTMYYFEDNDFAGVDENGRKYSIVWLPVAKRNDDNTWTYYGSGSTSNKLIGWYYNVEWYNASGVCVASDLIKINLANEDCANNIEPYYMSSYVTDIELKTAISDVSAVITWGEL